MRTLKRDGRDSPNGLPFWPHEDSQPSFLGWHAISALEVRVTARRLSCAQQRRVSANASVGSTSQSLAPGRLPPWSPPRAGKSREASFIVRLQYSASLCGSQYLRPPFCSLATTNRPDQRIGAAGSGTVLFCGGAAHHSGPQYCFTRCPEGPGGARPV